jgi:hypothetical protein
MKIFLLCLLNLLASIPCLAQTPISTDDALKQLYHEYNPADKTAHLLCTKEQKSRSMHAGWPCIKEDETVTVSIILSARVVEGDADRVYLVTSAKPAHDPEGGYNCHACAPAIGAALFTWKEGNWQLESGNAGVAFSGAWGGPPSVDLVTVGQQKHGLLLSPDDEGQGFSSSFKELLIPLSKSFTDVWDIQDEEDDFGTIDLDGKVNSPPLYHSSAAIRFFAAEGTDASDYYNIEVISRGTSWQGWKYPVKPENWTDIYSFKDGEYKLIRRTVFHEVRQVGGLKAR